ncbi:MULTISPECIES: hypothetical protein [Rhodococcus]|uniref:hypothetical protein n=1 Tax=Rhodococcus TaxID=1827 RepID=UPI000C7C1103|nr:MULTISPECIES: hypothetical protein [Rhodococcus]AUM16448.1 hypothetical protein CSW53_07875 [Rhodococcus ruber]
MAQVLIKGRIATVELGVGEEAVVEHTTRIEQLAELGYIRIIGSIAGTHNPPPAPVDLSPGVQAAADGEDPVDSDVEASAAESAAAGGEVPPRSGRGSGLTAWQQFLDHQDITYPADATRDDLVDLWDTHLQDQS